MAKIAEETKVNTSEQTGEEELVEIELFKDNKQYKDDVFVAVNGESCVIARGKKVMIKKKFAEVIENSMQQDIKTAKLMEAKADEFYNEAAERNI